MTEGEYRTLCRCCDSILLRKDVTNECVANSFLHILREHPTFLGKYENCFQDGGAVAKFSSAINFLLRNKVTFLVRLIKSTLSTKKNWPAISKGISSNADILFVSHLLNQSHNSIDDIYYGDLPRELSKEGYSVAIAYINHTGISSELILKRIKNEEVGIAIIPEVLSMREEIKIYFRLKKAAYFLKKSLKNNLSKSCLIILKQAILQADSSSSAKNLRIADQVIKMSVHLRAKVVITTYEGHAWERIVFHGLHERLPKTLCIGYVHAAIFRLQHSITRKLPNTYEPDMILTAGNIAKKQLKDGFNLTHVPVEVLGSSRVRQKKIITDNKVKKDVCLIIPEGITSEFNFLFNFAIECAALNPKINFIIRRHPLLQGKELPIELARPLKRLTNIDISNKSLDEDIDLAKWCMYRGSTAVIQSVIGGVTPIYIGIAGEMIIDPLYELASYRQAITRPCDFKRLVEATNEYNVEKKLFAMNYCSDFYKPFDIEMLKKVIGSSCLI